MGIVREFNMSLKQWSILFKFKDKKQIFKGRYGHSACLTPDKKSVLIFGGSESEPRSDLIMFDIEKNNFKRLFAPENF